MNSPISIRLATMSDVPILQELIDSSVRGLQMNDYNDEQIDRALATVYGVDTQLIEDGTYFVAEAKNDDELVIVGCGGWSKRKTLYGADHFHGREDTLLNPQTDAAKIRAFFIHPNWARRGIGTKILETCETAAKSSGFIRFEMGATLTGIPLYQARGYVEIENLEVPLGNGISLPIVRMAKNAPA